ncbi:hypothetical protein GQ37_005345 [Janthinobacterium sp. BJB1]|uniref:DUF6998 domain-containing protein n=1 Tax=Janthinobacterium sp. GW458P TaxID=1981504 RepID=UPI000C114165|nr:hypothetical protein [Janthinobacterium sp. GW458P]MBE3024828.1 hypothetical protein [Janthinobacterium sp. GW458P]PHV17870.1 hypothetical protein CSQ90_05995 [Janthinobacterium sp. BJB303]PJC99743.1 hypothetical protein GQ37_005345 [Janthinobacterium sp. BJB1]
MPKHKALSDGLALIFQGIAHLNSTFPNRKFTVDGRLVGDIGEIIAELEYDIILDEVSQPAYDGVTSDGKKRVQIKATFKDSLTFKGTPDYFLGFKLFPDGRHEEIYNGPGSIIYDRYAHRRGIGSTLLSFPNAVLKELSSAVAPDSKVQKRGI